MKYLELITLNAVSFGWVIINFTNKLIEVPQNWIQVFKDPEMFMAFMVGISIVFFNVARGIAVLRNKKNNKDV